MADYIGARLSLISKSDIRYVGILHEIDSQNSTVSLEQVRSFGTEGRKGDAALEIPASDNVFEYIVFRGSDVKDLRVESAVAPPPPSAAPKPQDPAILESGPVPTRPGQQSRQEQPPQHQQHAQQQQQQLSFPPQAPYGMPPAGYPGGSNGYGYPTQPPYGGPPPRGYGGYPGPGPMQGPPGGFGQGPAMQPMQHGQGFPPGPPGPPQGPPPQQQPQQARAPQGAKPSPFAGTAGDGFPELPSSASATAGAGPSGNNKPVAPRAVAPTKTAGATATQAKIVPALPLPQHASPAPAQQRKETSMADVTKGVSGLSTGQAAQPRQETPVASAAAAAPKTNALLEVKRTMPKTAPVGHQQPNQSAASQQQPQQQQQVPRSSQQDGNRRAGSPSQQRARTTRGAQGSGNVIVAQPLEIPAGEYDFAAANSKFEKPAEQDVQVAEPSYNKTSSFFDTLSSESQQRASFQQQQKEQQQQQQQSEGGGGGRGRGLRGQERAMNYETFGEDLKFTPGSRRGGRGRGRGGRGRGRGAQQAA